MFALNNVDKYKLEEDRLKKKHKILSQFLCLCVSQLSRKDKTDSSYKTATNKFVKDVGYVNVLAIKQLKLISSPYLHLLMKKKDL